MMKTSVVLIPMMLFATAAFAAPQGAPAFPWVRADAPSVQNTVAQNETREVLSTPGRVTAPAFPWERQSRSNTPSLDGTMAQAEKRSTDRRGAPAFPWG